MDSSEHNYRATELAQKDRHEAWKQLTGAYNSALTMASGAFILSISFIQYFDFRDNTILILKFTWLLLLFSVTSNIFFRYFAGNVEEIESWKRTPFVSKDPRDRNHKFYKIGKECSFWITWVGFIVGLFLLFIFVWINVDNGSSGPTSLSCHNSPSWRGGW